VSQKAANEFRINVELVTEVSCSFGVRSNLCSPVGLAEGSCRHACGAAAGPEA
jgi:hypothetical protein